MRTHFFAASVLTAFVLAPSAAISVVAQDHSKHAAPATAMACCDGHKAPPPMATACCGGNDARIAMAGLGLAEKPEVQTLAVTFRDPVRVGEFVLMGRYVIEHDDARMARGEPCTHVYEAADQRLPVVAFHCTHLERPEATLATVVLRRGTDNAIKELREFQFAGEPAAHGVPAIR